MMTSMQVLDLKNRQVAKTVDRPFLLVYEVNRVGIQKICRHESRRQSIAIIGKVALDMRLSGHSLLIFPWCECTAVRRGSI
jgi:hypothetical protein